MFEIEFIDLKNRSIHAGSSTKGLSICSGDQHGGGPPGMSFSNEYSLHGGAADNVPIILDDASLSNCSYDCFHCSKTPHEYV